MINDYDKQRLQAGQEFSNNAMEYQKTFTEDDIRKDKAFIEAYRVVDNYLNPQDKKQAPRMVQTKEDKSYPEKDDETLANDGMQLVSDMKNAFYTADSGMGLIGSYMKFKDAPQEVKDSMWYMANKYEEADMTWSAFGRALKSIGKDPSTYTGVGAGLKLFGGKAASSLAYNRFMTMLASGAVSAGATGGEEALMQELSGEYDPQKIAEMTSIGAVVGVIAPPTIEGVVKGTIAGTKAVGGKIADTIQEGEELMAQQAGGGTPPFTHTMFTDAKVDKFGNRKLKQKVHLKDGSRLSGMTSDDVFYGYDKNGKQFTVNKNNIKRSDIIQDTKQGKQLFDYLDKTSPFTIDEELSK